MKRDFIIGALLIMTVLLVYPMLVEETIGRPDRNVVKMDIPPIPEYEPMEVKEIHCDVNAAKAETQTNL